MPDKRARPSSPGWLTWMVSSIMPRVAGPSASQDASPLDEHISKVPVAPATAADSNASLCRTNTLAGSPSPTSPSRSPTAERTSLFPRAPARSSDHPPSVHFSSAGSCSNASTGSGPTHISQPTAGDSSNPPQPFTTAPPSSHQSQSHLSPSTPAPPLPTHSHPTPALPSTHPNPKLLAQSPTTFWGEVVLYTRPQCG